MDVDMDAAPDVVMGDAGGGDNRVTAADDLSGFDSDDDDPFAEHLMTHDEAQEFLRINIPMPSDLQIVAGLKILRLKNWRDQWDPTVISRAGKAMALKFHPDKAQRNNMTVGEASEAMKNISRALIDLRGHATFWMKKAEEEAKAVRIRDRNTARLNARFPGQRREAQLEASWLESLETNHEVQITNLRTLNFWQHFSHRAHKTD